MVERIEKLDPSRYRVQDAAEEREKQREGEGRQKKKERDKFKRESPLFKKVLQGAAPVGVKSGPAGNGEEVSLSLSQRVLVAWGVLDLKGRPRVPVIATYGIVTTLIVLGTLLILGILWP